MLMAKCQVRAGTECGWHVLKRTRRANRNSYSARQPASYTPTGYGFALCVSAPFNVRRENTPWKSDMNPVYQ